MNKTLLPSALAGLGFFAIAAPASAADEGNVVRLSPVTGWHAELKDGICSLSRSYGSTEQPTVLAFEHFGDLGAFTITVAGNSVSRDKRPKIKLQFGPAFEPQERDIDRGTADGLGNALLIASGSFRPLAAEQDGAGPGAKQLLSAADAAQAEWLRIEQSPGEFLEFSLPRFGDAFSVIEDCGDALVASWGFDPDEQKGLLKAVRMSRNTNWISRIRYPERYLLDGMAGRAWFRMNVNAKGRATECAAVKSTQAELFRNTCNDLLRYARFEPAIDEAGQPADSYTVTMIALWTN